MFLNTFLGNTNDLFDNIHLKNKIIENQVSENESYNKLFNYLKSEKLLNKEDIHLWNQLLNNIESN